MTKICLNLLCTLALVVAVIAAFAAGVSDHGKQVAITPPSPSPSPRHTQAAGVAPPVIVIRSPLPWEQPPKHQQPGTAASPAVSGDWNLPTPAGLGA